MSNPSVSNPGEIVWNTLSVVSINDVWLTLTFAYEIVLQWKIDRLQPESPLAELFLQWNGLPPAYQCFWTASRTVTSTIDSAGFS